MGDEWREVNFTLFDQLNAGWEITRQRGASIDNVEFLKVKFIKRQLAFERGIDAEWNNAPTEAG